MSGIEDEDEPILIVHLSEDRRDEVFQYLKEDGFDPLKCGKTGLKIEIKSE